MENEKIWILEIESTLSYGVRNVEQKFYANRPSIDDLVQDILKGDEHTVEELSKIKLLAEEQKLSYNTKKYRIYQITLIQN